MSPQIARIAYTILILGLFYFNRDRSVKGSPAVWISAIWLSIGASRSVSLWFGLNGGDVTADQYLEGSPFDRFLLTVFVIAALAILAARAKKVLSILASNLPVVAYIGYCAISIVWSDYSDVAAKRWVKALGDFCVVLIVLTEPNPLVSVRRLMSRTGFLLVPTSLLVIKYFPDLGRYYNRFTYVQFYSGVATDKNGLGLLCLVSGIGCVWQFIYLLREDRQKRGKGPLIAQGILLSIVCWLLWNANSMTSWSCFLMASTLMVCTSTSWITKRLWAVHGLTLILLALSITALFLDVGSSLVEGLGRDPSLTGRTEIWKAVLTIPVNPAFGTGFESFWLGKRLDTLWSMYWWKPNEAHNGYLETYLDLGWIGVLLLAAILVAGYRSVISAVRRSPEEGVLRLALLFTAIVYNCTESAIRIMHPAWICLLLAVTNVPGGWIRLNGRRQQDTTDRLIKFQSPVQEHVAVL